MTPKSLEEEAGEIYHRVKSLMKSEIPPYAGLGEEIARWQFVQGYLAGHEAAAAPLRQEVERLEERVRELTEAKYLGQSEDLRGIQHEHGCAVFRVSDLTGYYDGGPCDCGAHVRWIDLAAKRLRKLEGMVPKWVEWGSQQESDLLNSGWRIGWEESMPGNRQTLMVPPIPLPGAEKEE